MKTYEYQRNYDLERDYWWFVGVRSIVRELLHMTAPNGALGKVLDVGCGTGALLDELKTQTQELWGADIAPEALAFCRQRGHSNLVLGDAQGLDFPDASFDTITAIGVIEHLDDDAAFVREMQRLLKPGGGLVLLTSSFEFLWSEHDVANEHKRRYTLRGFKSLVESAGFSTVRASHINFLLFPALAPALIGHRLAFGLSPDKPERIMPTIPKLVNDTLARVLSFESTLIRRLSLPWGVSMVGGFRKAS